MTVVLVPGMVLGLARAAKGEIVMAYRDELDAALTQVAELKRDNERLLQIKAPERKARRRYFFLHALAALLVLSVSVTIVCAPYLRMGAQEESLRIRVADLRSRRDALRADIAQTRPEHRGLSLETTRLHDVLKSRQQQLDELNVRLSTASRCLSLGENRTEDALSRDHRLTGTQLAERLSHCVAYAGGSGRQYFYGEGVVTFIEETLDFSVRNSFGNIIPEVRQTALLWVPGRGEVAADPPGLAFPRDSTRDTQLTHALFWNRVEVGDILGISWRNEKGTEPQIIRLRLTAK